ncbi:MAG TPA: type II secretion system F family protein [Trinickia sp.]|jgi:tight adherence protein B|nr:type II secretion system F family protein [Trinickia sp.]
MEDSVSSGFAWLAALALVCMALALVLWQRGTRSQGRASAERFADSRIGRASGVDANAAGGRGVPGGAAATARGNAPASAAGVPTGGFLPTTPRTASAMPGASAAAVGAARAASQSARPAADAQYAGAGASAHWLRGHGARFMAALENMEARAGLTGMRAPVLASLGASAVFCAWAALYAGPLAACAGGIGCVAIGALFVAARSQRRRLTVVRQLPAFLDAIVRLVTLGNSVPAAFQSAVQTTEAPLRECLDHVSRNLRAGLEIDRALAHVAVIYRTREFEFVGAVLRLSVKYGGRADVMLDRMSVFMRDLEQAERELTSMSAETRLSACVLVALPLIIGGFLIATNPAYFSAMWVDHDGRRLVYIAFALQILGGYLLYRLTRLRS